MTLAANNRLETARAARAYLANDLSWEEFMDQFAESDDELISDLVDLIEHEPKRGGIFGLNETEWAEYETKVKSAIAALESG